MFCFKCGASMPDNARSCPQCGATTTPAPPPSVAAPAPAAARAPLPNAPASRPFAYTGPQQTDGKAVGSLILGVFAIFPLGLVAGIPAVVLGHLSRKSIRESLGRLKGEGMALAGLIMGYLSVAALPMVLIIAAIAIPSLLRSRMMANESGAASTIRVVNSAQVAYSTSYPAAGYARNLATLGPGPSGRCPGEGTQEHACLLDAALACSGTWCTKYGYKFNISAACEAGAACADYVITATPLTPGATGQKIYCSTSDAVIRAHTERAILSPLSVEECQSWPPIM